MSAGSRSSSAFVDAMLFSFCNGRVSARAFQAWLEERSTLDEVERQLADSTDASNAFLALLSMNPESFTSQIQVRKELGQVLGARTGFSACRLQLMSEAQLLVHRDFGDITKPPTYVSPVMAACLDDWSDPGARELERASLIRSWTELVGEDLRRLPDTPFFMDAESLLFNLPAYMNACYSAYPDWVDLACNCFFCIHKNIVNGGSDLQSWTTLTKPRLRRLLDFLMIALLVDSGSSLDDVKHVEAAFRWAESDHADYVIGL